MQVTFTFEANDPAIKQLLPALLARMSDAPAEREAPTETPAEPAPETPPAPAPEAPPEPTPAQQRAAHARAARAAAAAAKAEATKAPAEDLSGPVEPNGADTEEDFGMTTPSMSPGEAHEAALALVREIYAANKVAEVKGLQKEYGITKFYDIPLEKAHAFYASAMKIAHETGLRK